MAIDAVGICTPTFSTISAQSCGYYTSPSGKQLHDAGTYMDTILNSSYCDSIITINLTTTNTFATQNITSCTWTSPSGNVWYQSGTYLDTILNVANCDSVITTNYTTTNSFSSFPATACNSYTAPSGAIYTNGGVYSDTIPSIIGCDSIMTIALTVNYNNDLAVNISTCGDCYTSPAGNDYCVSGLYFENYFTINGCDSTISYTVNIPTGNAITIDTTVCDSFVSDAGIVYSASGSYQEDYTALSGCDSSRTYNVIVETLNSAIALVTVNGVPSNDMIQALQAGAAYQWVNCDNILVELPGETNQVFTATAVGEYACIVTNGTCSEMSDCIRIEDAIGLSIEDRSNAFALYPNPSNGMFTIELNDLPDKTVIQVINTAGQVIYSTFASDIKTNISLENIANGLYIVSVQNAIFKSQSSIIIN